MVMYYVEAEPNRDRSIKYVDLDVSSLKGIASQPLYEMNVSFTLTRSVALKSQDSNNAIGTSHDLALLNTTCELSFETYNGNQEQILHLKPTQDARLYVNGSKNHWVNRIIGSEREAKEVSLFDLETDDFLIATNFATFGFFRINYDECYFIMLANHTGLSLTLVN